MLLQDWIGIVSAVGLWAAALVALFGAPLWERLKRPKLMLRRAPPHLSVHKTHALPPRTSTPYECYYSHLEVANEGSQAAREVEVFLSGVYRRVDGAWVTDPTFTPEWLWWATIRNIAGGGVRGIYLPTLPPDARRYVDLAHVLDPSSRDRFPDEDFRDPEREKTLLSLDVAVTYLRLGHLLEPGDYKFTFEVAAANAPPRAFEVEIKHTGKWFGDKPTMRERGVVIGPVRAISGEAARVLAAQA
jgi:hypothetical protein